MDTKSSRTSTNQYYENLVASMPGYVYWKNREGKYIACNDRQAEEFGLSSSQEIVGKTDSDLLPKDKAMVVSMFDERIMETGVPSFFSEQRTLKDGSSSTYIVHKVPTFDANNEITGLLGMYFDTTHIASCGKFSRETPDLKAGLTLDHIIANLPEHVYWKDINGGTIPTGGGTQTNPLVGTEWVLTKMVSAFATEYPNDTISFQTNTP